jgi:hypothetical protein
MSTRILHSLAIAALLAYGIAHAENTIQVVNEHGTSVAQFKIGDSRCVLKDDQIRCTPVNR